jgi:hypothetical protein
MLVWLSKYFIESPPPFLNICYLALLHNSNQSLTKQYCAAAQWLKPLYGAWWLAYIRRGWTLEFPYFVHTLLSSVHEFLTNKNIYQIFPYATYTNSLF